MDGDSHIHRDSSGKSHFVYRREDYINFYQAYLRKAGGKSEQPHPEKKDIKRVSATTVRAKQLIGEYTKTAERVGANFDTSLLLKVINALKHESSGTVSPLSVSCKSATERFLAESLYREMLELPLLTFGAPRKNSAGLITPDEWRDCLETIGNTISNHLISFFHAN